MDRYRWFYSVETSHEPNIISIPHYPPSQNVQIFHWGVRRPWVTSQRNAPMSQIIKYIKRSPMLSALFYSNTGRRMPTSAFSAAI